LTCEIAGDARYQVALDLISKNGHQERNNANENVGVRGFGLHSKHSKQTLLNTARMQAMSSRIELKSLTTDSTNRKTINNVS
jgi:hypothetical protein